MPAGLASMNIGTFAFYTAIGTALWSFLLAYAGRLLGSQWMKVSEFIDRYEHAVMIAGVLAAVAFFVHRWWKRDRVQKDTLE